MKKLVMMVLICSSGVTHAGWWDCTVRIIDKHWGYDRYNSQATVEVEADRRTNAEYEAIKYGFYKKGFLSSKLVCASGDTDKVCKLWADSAECRRQ